MQQIDSIFKYIGFRQAGLELDQFESHYIFHLNHTPLFIWAQFDLFYLVHSEGQVVVSLSQEYDILSFIPLQTLIIIFMYKIYRSYNNDNDFKREKWRQKKQDNIRYGINLSWINFTIKLKTHFHKPRTFIFFLKFINKFTYPSGFFSL